MFINTVELNILKNHSMNTSDIKDFFFLSLDDWNRKQFLFLFSQCQLIIFVEYWVIHRTDTTPVHLLSRWLEWYGTVPAILCNQCHDICTKFDVWTNMRLCHGKWGEEMHNSTSAPLLSVLGLNSDDLRVYGRLPIFFLLLR